MPTSTYFARRGRLSEYFDKTAVEAWARLTTDAPVSRIRATVRAGRDRMRQTLLDWLPPDLHGLRVLDAGCGTGALSVAAAERGAEVVAVDLSASLIELARERSPESFPRGGRIDFQVGDFIDPALGLFDYAVAMDSLIHYHGKDISRALAQLAGRTERGILMTFAPRTPALATMHAVGKVFPRSDRAPAIEPISHGKLTRLLATEPDLADWQLGRTSRIASGFYTSQALELTRQ
ncbi:magnesium protoporphyrin IX methyltransferase [Dichotomicrobium thermohalophilum]|uniref:Magnesium protoporphyrin IX methyltransferase n=1 Tax=Dichotomicrobium thermohalophilum TaxID=933063 RepID=A0A397QEL9_9HYPH|nr:magnesium protoporphyrin IX methyltransferase [Dichotomicrobium thermohalophilum]RIA56721.1 Mg-protoporphyrin IX methyltransferase [Dichotomicrobium thermohalophilum]